MSSCPAKPTPPAVELDAQRLARLHSFMLARISRIAGERLSGLSRLTPP